MRVREGSSDAHGAREALHPSTTGGLHLGFSAFVSALARPTTTTRLMLMEAATSAVVANLPNNNAPPLPNSAMQSP